ncbi:hypothetical protein U879_14000 [Defluviimonas sp. 20V17]|uniref:Lipase n=1 Tax=Allgaiera indica TaxID=765699 RepID=A0AAN4UQG1_9RHOB|nr:alpha/beta fold hydrolase [Allgaiera indica]KDB03105.1 hypothetical protein U879_14000 [Defluviimonas sp. 20V17]GHE00799.1 lipase [Allgaiera indica]SDW71329.1 Predicted dienelactone hydrolase [Allgaiera indica]
MSNRIDRTRPDAPALARRGTYPVGVRSLTLVNPDQPDVFGAPGARADRALAVELWYPAANAGAGAARYPTLLRDGHRRLTLHGGATRDATPAAAEFPLVILSHGYPGNRMLLGHFGEFLASHGYRVASIDHLHSTYGDPAYLAGKAFAATLIHRPLDVAFVAETLGGDYAVIGYSMGGYGALVLAGAGISAQALTTEMAPPHDLWRLHRAPKPPARLRAILAIGPWGGARALWDAAGLGAMRLPCLIMAGTEDDVSGYDTGMRRIFAETGGPTWLLSFIGAGHNAAAPIPAPDEAWEPSPHLDWPPFAHYADPVWDSTAMNNIAQHFARAFLDLHLKRLSEMADYLRPGWKGFEAGRAPGLVLEQRG